MTFKEIKKRVELLLNGIKHSEYDRQEDTICGIQVRAWRTRIRGKIRIHLGWKPEWTDYYYQVTYSELVEFLFKRREA